MVIECKCIDLKGKQMLPTKYWNKLYYFMMWIFTWIILTFWNKILFFNDFILYYFWGRSISGQPSDLHGSKDKANQRNPIIGEASSLLQGSAGLPYLERSLRRLRTSWRASFPAAWLPQHSVARARWLVRRLDTCRASPECTASVEPPSELKREKAWWNPKKPWPACRFPSAPLGLLLKPAPLAHFF